MDIPVIDISVLSTDDQAAKSQAAEKIHSACRSSGFFYASGHDLNLDEFRNFTTSFHFTLPQSEKWRVAINAYNKSNPHFRNGYYMAIPGKKAVESYCFLNPLFTDKHPAIKDNLPLHEVNLWPDSPLKGAREFYENHYWQMFNFASLLLRGYALALGKDEKFFEPYFKKSDTLSSVSLIRYPYLKNYPPVKVGPDGQELGFEDHLDVSLITILCQTTIDNLQVEYDGQWQDIPASADYLLINAGTYMAHITNNYFHAPNHRVKHVNAERLSLPYFVNLGYYDTVEPFAPFNHKTGIENQNIQYGSYLNDELHALILKNGQT